MSIQALGVLAFLLLVVGTAGLLLNELVIDWGTEAVLIFAALNVLGLIVLAIAMWRERQEASA